MKNTMLTILAFLLSLSACTAKDATRDVLKDAGFTHIETGGYAFFMCSEDDTLKTQFTATAPDSDRRVSGAVCCGMLAKGCTIRFDR